MKIMVIGSGGREHTIVWKLKQSLKVEQIFCAPGNGGIAQLATCVDIKVEDINGLLNFAQKEKIDLTVVGPETPLVAGIVDAFEKKGFKIFGPSKSAAQLEGSKIFAKMFMAEEDIPTAIFATFDQIKDAKIYLKKNKFPVVLKADGLAAGKGVVICQNEQEAFAALDQIMGEKIFKDAGSKVVIEEFLQGEEVSVLAICDGDHFVMLESSQDHKRAFDQDQGPNTGGMGAYSPAPVLKEGSNEKEAYAIIEQTIKGMKKSGRPFKGVLYAGLMITAKGVKVLEYNVRFGDPETQVILPRLKNDFVDLMLASCEGHLDQIKLEWDPRSAVCVVMAAKGYPGDYAKGLKISGLDQAALVNDAMVFHAGTVKKGDDILTAGGRVLGVTALGDGIKKAIDSAYEAVQMIQWDGCFYRRDIGYRALERLKNGM
ncbi:MAG: phosphoribosylamine--glycine ligase [Candidatus Omnitrophica bacterium]|nr:phosphoribosylamine--glycine ligase [Candidatus Omnitrophota bacterium]